MSDKPGMAERYLRATSSSNLQTDAEHPGDIDKLMAAAWVSHSPRRDLALRVWRVRATGSVRGVHRMADDLGDMLQRQEADRRHGRYLRGSNGRQLTAAKARGLAMTVLKWWRQPRCEACDGLGHPKMLNAPVLDLTRECPNCHGTGQAPLELRVRQEHIDQARWLVGQMESLSAMVFDAMARRLNDQMNF